MSELKATTAQEIVRNEKDCDYMDELFGGVKMPPTQVYLKSEADKVIADLEESNKMEVEQLLMEIVELKEKLVEQATLRAWAELQLRRQKYKRCLAMAKWCDTKADWYYGIGRSFRDRVEFYIKWHKRWLMIAEQFKEAK